MRTKPELELRPIKAVLFDWGDTLVQYPGFSTDGTGHLEAVEKFFLWFQQTSKCRCLTPNNRTTRNFVNEYQISAQAQFAVMKISGRDQPMGARLVQALRQSGCNCKITEKLEQTYLQRLLDELANATIPMPGALQVLSAMHNQFKLAVVSNFPEPQFVKQTLDKYSLINFFDSIIVSAEVGWMKPHPLPFQLAMEKLQVDPSNVLFIGDDLKSDMAGAASVGCKTAWLRNRKQSHLPIINVDYVLENLIDLLSLPVLR